MNRSKISKEERESILERHLKAGYKSSNLPIIKEENEVEFEMTERKMESVEDLEKEIEKLEKKLEELKSKKSKKKETKEDNFDDLVNSDVDIEAERDSLEQA